MRDGYYLLPSINKDRIVFVSDDDLWLASLKGGKSERLTALNSTPTHPFFSPDGKWIAFTASEEGMSDIYVVSASGGPIKRLTYIGLAGTKTAGWSPDGRHIIYLTTAGMPFRSHAFAYQIPLAGGQPERLPYGPAASVSYGPKKGVVIGRFGRDPAQWKRYRGGRMGVIWIDRTGSGSFKKLLDLNSNMTYPMWIGDRIYFMGDHEGFGNMYSCDLTGKNILRHTDHEEFYVRNPRTDGERIVYHCGGDLYVLDPGKNAVSKVDIDFPSTRPQLERKFASCGHYLEQFEMHPEAHTMLITARGKPFSFAHWEGAVAQYGLPGGSVRYRLAAWLNDGKRIVAVSDEGGDESIVVFSSGNPEPVDRLTGMDFGRPISILVNPQKDEIALTNQRQELIIIDLSQKSMQVIDRSDFGRLDGHAYSPDGRWIAYAFRDTRKTSVIKLFSHETGLSHEISKPLLWDYSPCFDPSGKYLYFLSVRVFDPVMDSVSFDYNFPKGIKPMLITLKADLKSPFLPEPKPLAPEPEKSDAPSPAEKALPPVDIDLDGIKDRLLAFPVPEGRYCGIWAANKKAFFSQNPVEGTLSEAWLEAVPAANRTLECYDFEKQTFEVFLNGISTFGIAKDGKSGIYRAGERLRVVKTDEKPDEKSTDVSPSRKSGWIDLSRVKISVNPPQEWLQMYRETWRLLRDHYHHADMSGVDWNAIYERYLPLISRISTRFELSDVLWELGGEMGTSHCYEIGGEYKSTPHHAIGLLGADLAFDRKSGGYKITRIVRGDSWDESQKSPLCQPGAAIDEGDILMAINGYPLNKVTTPGMLLAGLAGQHVTLAVLKQDGRRIEAIVITLLADAPLRLREWIDRNAEYVHRKTGGKAGYVYMQDMGSTGYSQFFRSFLTEVQRESLIVDVRNNGGGHVSQLLLEKLARRRLGYDIPRYGKWSPIPTDSLLGPIVALTDEHSGSDGDIFSHTFKMMKLGLLIGKRTWGGIVGLNPTHFLVDGTVTTQPEFYNWFHDVGWELENWGAVPDIDVDIAPQDYENNIDPQLDRAIAEILKDMKKNPRKTPDFGKPPSRKPPKLPRK